MNFKTIYRAGLGLIAMLGLVLSMQGCNEDDVDGAPVITNVRLLDPVFADSSLSAALPGSLIVIQGQNLGGVLKVYFNDFESTFNAALGSDQNIIITVPAGAPTKAENPNVPNKIRVVTKGGETTYDFGVTAPQPRLEGLYSEFVKPGGTIIINGNYFYNIKAVKLGTANLEIVSSTTREIRAKMPATAPIDYLQIEGEFGTVKTSFRLNDTTVHMINFDVPATSWGDKVCWGKAPIVAGTDPGAISGQFSRIRQANLPAAGYDDNWVFSTCTFDFKLPAGNAETRLFKFEHNIVESWSAGKYDITITADKTEYTYSFQPWNTTTYQSTGYQTNGWKTAVIELSEFKSSSGGTIADVSKITDLKVLFNTPDKVIASFNGSVDNFRIVRK